MILEEMFTCEMLTNSGNHTYVVHELHLLIVWTRGGQLALTHHFFLGKTGTAMAIPMAPSLHKRGVWYHSKQPGALYFMYVYMWRCMDCNYFSLTLFFVVKCILCFLFSWFAQTTNIFTPKVSISTVYSKHQTTTASKLRLNILYRISLKSHKHIYSSIILFS